MRIHSFMVGGALAGLLMSGRATADAWNWGRGGSENAGSTEEEDHEPLKSAWAERPMSVELLLGIATPVGWGGVSVDVAPFEWLSVGCSLGKNWQGAEYGCMTRARVLRSDTVALGLGLGASAGPHSQNENTQSGVFSLFSVLNTMGHGPEYYPGSYEWDWVPWLNTELGGEFRTHSGLTGRCFFGIAWMLGDPQPEPITRPAPGDYRPLEARAAMAYAGTTLGYAF